ncbi:alpha/beta hydrolase family protein [Hymenobacter algoricola]|uniref:Alpha/beta hydrolase n=1 Tax=Hymenobacter algoricola TaxID=486267 RepID=A0ABP7NRP1_9BACT
MRNRLLFTLLLFLVLCFPLLSLAGRPGGGPSLLGGQWKGQLAVPGGSLGLIITIVPLTNGSYYAALDVPQQKISRMPVEVIQKDNEVTLSIEQAGSRFAGKLRPDTGALNGTWTQPGLTAPLILIRSNVAVTTAPKFKVALPYRLDDVIVPNKVAKLRLGATLTMPQGSGPFPAVVLVSDSGPQDRDAEQEEYRMFGQLADYLTRHGIAVLRYDDRGMGKSTGTYSSATTADLVTDAQAAMGYLRAHYRVNKSQVGIIGHGEGANIALLAASQPKAPDFVVSLAGYGMTGRDVLQRQQVEIMRLIGANPAQVDAALKMDDRLVAVVRQTPDDALARAKVGVLLRQSNANIDPAMARARAVQLTSPWYRYFIDFDPQRNMAGIKCPILAMNGTADLQVTANKNLTALHKGLRTSGNRRVTVQKLNGVNHLFQSDPSEWPVFEGEQKASFSPEALKVMHGWIAQQVIIIKPAAVPITTKRVAPAASKSATPKRGRS